MIARVWSAWATSDRASAYAGHLATHVMPALRQVPGYAGAMLLQCDLGENVEIVVITWWQSREAIRAFAGDDVERAVVASEAAALLTRFDDRVRHYEVVLRDEGKGTGP